MEDNANPQRRDADVIIVGGGPVGLGLAIDLAQRGVEVHVVERTTALHRIPKGQNLTQRTGEHFRRWGIAAAVRAASPIPRDFGNAGLVAYGNLTGDYHYEWFRRGAVGRYYFAENERLPQYELERVLRERAAGLQRIAIDYGWTATAAGEDDDGVTVSCRPTAGGGAARTLRGRYAVGCDGARSTVREAAGIGQAVDPHGKRMCLLVFRSTELNDVLARFAGTSFFNILAPELDGYWRFLGRVDLDGTWFFHAPVPPETTAENFDFASTLHEAIGARFAVEFEHIGFWDLRISIAETYRNGRLFIAGDAAHSHPPYGGYGVNTGLEDARNLGWKLAATLAGWGGETLLASYSEERRPVFASTARDFINRMIEDDRAFGRTYSPAADRAAFETAWAARASGGNADVTQYLPNYAGSPIVWGEARAESGATGTHDFAARAGHHLAPQALTSGADMFAALGDGFTLLSFGADPSVAEAFRSAAAKQSIPLTAVEDAGGPARAAYGASLILVRPDHFVAWAGDRLDRDAAAILARASGNFL